MSNADRKSVVDDLAALLDTHDLYISEARGELDILVSREAAQATHADRELILAWTEKWADVADIAVSELVDLTQPA